MGWYGPCIKICAHLSRHNSRNDQIDNLLYEEMVERIREITSDTRYAGLNVDVVTDGIDWKSD